MPNRCRARNEPGTGPVARSPSSQVRTFQAGKADLGSCQMAFVHRELPTRERRISFSLIDSTSQENVLRIYTSYCPTRVQPALPSPMRIKYFGSGLRGTDIVLDDDEVKWSRQGRTVVQEWASVERVSVTRSSHYHKGFQSLTISFPGKAFNKEVRYRSKSRHRVTSLLFPSPVFQCNRNTLSS